MKITKQQLRSLIRENIKKISEVKPFRMPDSYYEPPDEDEIPDEIYDDLEDIFERAARSNNKKYQFKGTDGDYTLVDETDPVGDALPMYTLVDPDGKEEDFYIENKDQISTLEDRILDVLMRNFQQTKEDIAADSRWD